MRQPSRPVRAAAGRAAIAAIMLFMLAAGLAKAADPPLFAATVARWSLIPRALVIPIAVLVPAAEIGLAAAWLLGLARRLAVAGVALLLVLFSAVYAVHLAAGPAPPCGCLGAMGGFDRMMGEGPAVLARNAVLLAILSAGLAALRSAPSVPAAPAAPGPTVAAARPGFTLIEVVAVVAITGILLAVTVPALHGARGRARRTASLAYLRSHAQIFAKYNGDHRDAMPQFLDPRRPSSTVRNTATGFELTTYYFMSHATWNIGLADPYYDGNHLDRTFTPPETPPDLGGGWPVLTGYFYSCAFSADPAYWNPRTRTGPAQWRGTRSHEIAFPSAKGLLWGSNPPPAQSGDGALLRAAFSDASARLIKLDSLGPMYQGADGGWPGAIHGVGPPPFMHTLDGARGRDVR